jgi:hypothetical protein
MDPVITMALIAFVGSVVDDATIGVFVGIERASY